MLRRNARLWVTFFYEQVLSYVIKFILVRFTSAIQHLIENSYIIRMICHQAI